MELQLEASLRKRVNELYNALNLTDIKNMPAARLHRLQGKRADEFAVDLVHPYRLIFKPMLQEEADINDLNSITVVRIEEVTDYHGKLNRK